MGRAHDQTPCMRQVPVPLAHELIGPNDRFGIKGLFHFCKRVPFLTLGQESYFALFL